MSMANPRNYDAIVIGTGGMGSAACFHLARLGARVLGLEQFAIAHDRGSSHGETRIVRRAYFEHPDYVPLLNRAFELWEDLDREKLPEKVLVKNGMVIYGDAVASPACLGSIASAEQHQIPIERWNAAEARGRYGIYRPPEGFAAVFEPGAGFVRVEAAVRAHSEAARAKGAEIRSEERVTHFEVRNGRVAVETDRGSYGSRTAIITAGAWSGPLLGSLGLPLKIKRMVQYWFEASSEHLLERGVPCFAFDLDDDFYYGFPMLDGKTVKLAAHRAGDWVSSPDELSLPSPDPGRLVQVQEFVKKHLPHVTPKLARFKPCLYTMTPDEHFIIDKHPKHPEVFFAAGFSGHGFKFTPVVGEALAELAITGQTRHPIGFLGLERLSGKPSSRL
jgi:monomeric sarcosine oxidase